MTDKNVHVTNDDKKFHVYDLQVGYLVKLRNGDFRMVAPAGKDTLILLSVDGKWDYLSRWNTKMCYHTYDLLTRRSSYEGELDIMEVYGLVQGTENYGYALTSYYESTRKLLWSRVETRKMTVSEICKELGYPVEIVAEN